jgi:hypothetical protein
MTSKVGNIRNFSINLEIFKWFKNILPELKPKQKQKVIIRGMTVVSKLINRKELIDEVKEEMKKVLVKIPNYVMKFITTDDLEEYLKHFSVEDNLSTIYNATLIVMRRHPEYAEELKKEMKFIDDIKVKRFDEYYHILLEENKQIRKFIKMYFYVKNHQARMRYKKLKQMFNDE